MMKAFAVTIILFLAAASAVIAMPQTEAAGSVSLVTALSDFSVYIAGKVPKAQLTAIAVTDVPVKKLGDYIADELSGLLLNNAGLRMVSRQDFERVLAEQSLQADIGFNDDTTAKMGRNFGWQTVILTAVNPLVDSYRLSLRAVDVETGELRGTKSFVLNTKDPILISLVNPDVTVQQLAERETILKPFNGNSNNFKLNVSANKNVYYDNETMFITLNSNEDCYFVVYHVDVFNKMQVIYPNAWERDRNFLRANVQRIIPENSTFLLCAPYGEERILVYASKTPFNIPNEQYQSRSISSDILFDPDALWHVEESDEADSGSSDGLVADSGDSDNAADPPDVLASAEIAVIESGSRGVSAAPKGATAQISYTILPK